MPMLNFARVCSLTEINRAALVNDPVINADSSVDFSRGAHAGEVNCIRSCLKYVGLNSSYLVSLKYYSCISPRCDGPFKQREQDW